VPDTSGNNVLKRASKASKSELDWVRTRAKKAEKELDREQTNSVVTIARALEDIADTEARAELDTRLAMVEEQLERLLERRDEVDQATQAELAVMRARIEDALDAIGAASESQRLTWAAMEERLPPPSSTHRALESAVDDLEQRARKSGRQILDDVEATLERWRSEVGTVIEALNEHFEGAKEAQEAAANRSAEEMEARATAMLAALEARVAAFAELGERTEGPEVEPEPDETGKLLSIELDQRISEAKNDIRLELFELRKALEGSLKGLGELVDWSHRDSIGRIRGSEEKAASAAVYLESMVRDHGSQLARDRNEWSDRLLKVAGDVASLKLRLDGMKEPPGPDR
jgi:hypothetical protein